MPINLSDNNLFIIDLNYTVSFDKVDPEIDDHIKFLEENYASGRFIASGPKVPRTGGVIIAAAFSREEIETLLEMDPFKIKKIAQYKVTEFRPSMMIDELKR